MCSGATSLCLLENDPIAMCYIGSGAIMLPRYWRSPLQTMWTSRFRTRPEKLMHGAGGGIRGGSSLLSWSASSRGAASASMAASR